MGLSGSFARRTRHQVDLGQKVRATEADGTYFMTARTLPLLHLQQAPEGGCCAASLCENGCHRKLQDMQKSWAERLQEAPFDSSALCNILINTETFVRKNSPRTSNDRRS